MELLLLLTAIFASLTGAAADRGAARQVQGVAVVRAAEMAQAAVQPARQVAPHAAVPLVRPVVAALPMPAAPPLGKTHSASERWLE